MDTPFKIHCALEAFEKSGDENPMRIGGLVSTDQLDKQGETIVQKGLDFKPFLDSGWFNDNHGQKSTDVVGYPTDAKYVSKGDRLPNGKQAETNGWWAEGYLLNTDEGRKLYGLASALTKSPRRLGFSIEGRVVDRDPRNESKITRAIIKNVAVTHCPVNPGTELVTLAKALMAGGDIAAPTTQGPGQGFALRGESLDDGPGDDPGDLDVEIDEVDLAKDWAPTIAKRIAQPDTTRLSKAEARIIVRSLRPNLPPHAVDQIVRNAAR